MSIVSFDSSLLLGFYQSQLNTQVLLTAGANTSATTTNTNPSSKPSATAKDVTPWTIKQPAQSVRDAQVLNTTNFLDLSKVPVLAGMSPDTKTEQDNQKLFALYTAVNNLSYLATMSNRTGVSAGQMAGYDARFQTGLQQIENFVSTAKFNNFTLQSAAASSSATSAATVPNPTFGYDTRGLVSGANISNPLAGLSTTDSFTIAVKKAGVTSNVLIDLSKVSGALTLDNVLTYVNSQLSAAGCASRFQKVITSGTIDQLSKATFGIQINNAPSETLTLSSAAATPSLYVSGTVGLTSATSTSPADNQGRLLKLSNLSNPTGTFSVNANPSSGTTTASSTVVDSNGDVYVVGSATGNYGSQFNAGSQDVYLTKYDSAGKVMWTRMLGSAGTASGASLALNPTGGVTIVGTTNAALKTTSIVNGNQDSFATRYDANGNQVWTTQIQTLNNNQGTSVSVDASGNVYIGGQTTGSIGGGQAKIGGSDAYITKLDNTGKVVYEQQFGTTANDSVSATALTSTGDLMVASVQNGHAILSKYAGGNATAAPTWQMDLGALNAGGTITGIAVSGSKVYVTGTTQNTALNAGSATVVSPSSGGLDAYVFSATDNGTTATANTVTYLGTSGTDKGGGITVDSSGTVYVTGTTTGTFAGQTRTQANTNNMFVASLAANGTTNWVRQYGGLDGQSAGTGITVDPNGSSVLDALGLPSGTLPVSTGSDLLSSTTLRPGDSFQMKIESNYNRTATITIDQGETLQSLVTKLNGQLWGAGQASVVYGGSGSSLKIQVKAGVSITLASGPANFDALKRLGLTPGLLSSTTAPNTTTPSNLSKASTQTFSLGLDPKMSISTATGASTARAKLLGVLSAIQKAYQTTNMPAAAPGTGGAAPGSGTVSPYQQSQLANYSLAASLMTIG